MGEEEEKKGAAPAAANPAKESVSYDHVFSAWCPAHPASLALIKDRIKKGEYRADQEKLCQDIKGDVSLFMHCIAQVKNSNDAIMQSDNPVGLLRDNLRSNVNHLFGLSDRKISQHGFSSIEKSQAQAMKHALLSCSTADVIAKNAGIDADMTFSIGAFREFAMNLVAWNYPRIYSRALTKSSGSGDPFEVGLGKGLGFPPRNLAIKLAKDWGFDNKMINQISSVVLEDPKVLTPQSACEVGEIFASSLDADLQKTIAPRWADISKRIDHVFGPGGIEKLRAQVSERISHYTVSDPGRFSLEAPLGSNNSITNVITTEHDLLLSQNLFALRCSDSLQVMFREVYKQIVKEKPSPQALQDLIMSVIPQAGFKRGCMFLADTTTLTIVPKLRIGDQPLTRYSNANGASRSTYDHLRQVLFGKAPISQRDQIMFGEVVSFICGTLKKGKMTGILYLELSPEFQGRSDDETQLVFRAIRQCFADCIEPGS